MISMIQKRQMAAKKNKKKGFTLIEVIVVIVIIAILAAIAVPSLTRYIGSAERRSVQATAHNIQVVLQAERSDQYQHTFADGTINGTTTAYTGPNGAVTYDTIFRDNGIIVDWTTESITGLTWGSGAAATSLMTFTYENANYSIAYNRDNGGFQPIVDKP